ncbi:cyclic-di-AMP-binding protein CbpB [Streptococcus pneumoniae]
MIDKAFETYLLEQEETFLTPADNLAVLIDTHNVDHAILLLSQITYSRVPVITADKEFVGTISLTDILSYQLKHDLPDEEFLRTDIVDIVEKDRPTVGVDFTVTEVLHKLVDESFLPVVDEQHHFQGIITRKSILKAINALLHNFASEYEMIAK